MKRLTAILCLVTVLFSVWPLSVMAQTDAVSIGIDSNNTGNIFFSGENIEFYITLTNNTAEDLSINVSFNIYQYDKDFNKTLKKISEHSLTLSKSCNKIVHVEYNAEEYGLYFLDVLVSGQASAEYGEEFSKVIKNTVLNKTFGCASQMYGVTLGGDPALGIPLMANAGIGLIREAPHWTDYEKTSGSYALTDAMKESCELSYQYGLDRIMTILCRNGTVDSSQLNISNYISSEDALEAIQRYVTKYLLEPAVKKSVTMVEVENEPQMFSYMDQVDLTGSDDRYVQLGDRYAKIAIAVAKGAKSAGDFPVGLLSIADVEEESTKTFTKNTFDTILESGNKNLFSAITMHPYIRNRNTEDSIVNNIKYYDSLMKRYGMQYDEKWHTEYGFSTYTKSEWNTAAEIIREYARLKSYGFKDRYCVYQLIDNVDAKSTNESQKHYGILKSYKEVDVPYAAKYAYLASAALNKLTENALSCDTVYDEDGAYICRFRTPVKEVYMMWDINNEDNLCDYKRLDNAVYYDMLGNQISENNVMGENGGYRLSGTPFYAVVGEEITLNENAEKFTVTVDGNIESGKAGKMVSFALLKPGYENKDNIIPGIVSMNQNITGENGSYSFETNLYDYNGTVNAYIVSEDSSEPLIFSFTNMKEASYKLQLMSGIVKLNEFDLSLLAPKDSTVSLEFSGLNRTESSSLFYALYNKGKLVDAHICKDTLDSESGKRSYPLEIKYADQYDEIKIFMWNSALEPLCSVLKVVE